MPGKWERRMDLQTHRYVAHRDDWELGAGVGVEDAALMLDGTKITCMWADLKCNVKISELGISFK